jgi:hypothetical protein
MTTDDHVVRYHEHVSTKSYEELVAAFEEAVDAVDPAAIADTITAASKSADSRQTWETATKSLPGGESPFLSPPRSRVGFVVSNSVDATGDWGVGTPA